MTAGPAQPERAAGVQLTWLGAVVNLGLTALKAAVGWLGHSQAMLADAVHSLSDLVSDVLTLLGLRLGGRAPDANHHFGHGRLETLTAIVVALLVVVVALGMAIQALGALMAGRASIPSWPVLPVAAVSVAAKEMLYRLTMRVGRRARSQLLMANAWHHRSDALSSVAVLVGVGAVLVKPEWHILDQLVALLVSALVLKVGLSIAWQALAELTDRAPPEDILADIRACITRVPGVLGAHDIKVRSIAGLYQMHAHVVVDGGMTVQQGHDIADSVRNCLYRDIVGMSDVTIHIDPSPGQVGEAGGRGDHD